MTGAAAGASLWRHRVAPTPALEFLKRRYGSAIERADDRTARRLRAEIDRLINDPSILPALAGAADAARSAMSRRGRATADHDDLLRPFL